MRAIMMACGLSMNDLACLINSTIASDKKRRANASQDVWKKFMRGDKLLAYKMADCLQLDVGWLVDGKRNIPKSAIAERDKLQRRTAISLDSEAVIPRADSERIEILTTPV